MQPKIAYNFWLPKNLTTGINYGINNNTILLTGNLPNNMVDEHIILNVIGYMYCIQYSYNKDG